MLKSYIEKIESQLFDKAILMELPTIEGDLGVLIFEATLYRYSKQEIYKEKALKLFNKLIAVFSDHELPSGFLEGFEGIFYTIQYLHKCDIIDDTILLKDLEVYLLQSLTNDFNISNFDPLHGSIPKLLYFINSTDKQREEIEPIINDFLNSLYENRIEINTGFLWKYPYGKENKIIDLGIAHGVSGILSFLLRLKALNYQNQYLDILIKGILKSISSFKNKIKCGSIYPSTISENSDKIRATSRLAWCNGDLGIAHTLLYASKVLKDDSLYNEVLEIMGAIVHRKISTSNIVHYEDYSFFDTGFCHGIGGIVYTLQKINQDLNDDFITKRIDYWEKQLMSNLEIQLSIQNEIYLPWERQDKDGTYTLDKVAALNGYTGVGLVLLSMQYKKYDWSDFFMLFNN